MKHYSYIITRDFGFAPNPYFGYCTLATCKPRIRKGAKKGDWIAAYGGSNTKIHNKLVVLMRVEEIVSFDQYWNDDRFREKRPTARRSLSSMYGDNIYHKINGEWKQENSHHSMPDGNVNLANLRTDTSVDYVLIATQYYYFGNNAIEIPHEFDSLICKNRGHKVCENEEKIKKFIDYINNNYNVGIHGVPYSRKIGKFAHYKGKKK